MYLKLQAELNLNGAAGSGHGGTGSSSEDLLSLSRLPSPMERSGSLIGEPQLPAPLEFMDQKEISCWSDSELEEMGDENKKGAVHLSPVSGWEAAIRSRARLSTRLRSVPEKHSVVSFVHDIRRRGLEPERRVSAVELCATTPIPNSPISKSTLEPSDASTIVVKRRGKNISTTEF